ncbi:MAG: prolyl oligopeptidase family serine peptidase, partial [Candidatus Thorarchaeota archaeon]|nr:prolyl oligopeptidase family serine peptidase [Candidatus Thorarchaeota archaeon]
MPSGEDFRRFLSVEIAGGASWHPIDDRIVFVHDNPGVNQVYSTDIEEGRALWPERLVFEEDRCTSPRYLSDGSIIYTRDRGGDENFQIGRIEKSGKSTWISDDLKAKHRITFSNELGLFYIANREDKSRLDVYLHRMPLEHNEPELLIRPDEGIMTTQAVSPNNKLAIISRLFGNVNQELMLFDLESKELKSITGNLANKPTRWETVRFIEENLLLVMTDHESDFKRLAFVSLNGEFKTIPQIEENCTAEVEHATFSSDDVFTYYSINEEGYSRVFRGIFNSEGIENHGEIRLPLKGVLVSGDQRSFTECLSLSPDGSKLALTISTPTENTNIWIVNTGTLNSWRATYASMSGLPPSRFSDAALDRFHSFDELSVPYFSYLPKGEMPTAGWPAIMMIHGGPEAQMRPTFNPVIQFFVSAGYAVITPNIRGSDGYGKTYIDLDNVEKRLDSILDIKHLYLHLKENNPKIDSDRFVIYGGSYGGFAVLSAITEHPELWKAAVDIVGISDFVTFLQNTAAWRRGLRESEYGSLEHDRDTLIKISPIHKVDNIQCPLFIIQGDNDERVPLSESTQIYESVKNRGIPVEL